MTVREHMALTLAAARYKYPGVRETHIREQLGMSSIRHSQVVAHLLERPDAEAEMPEVVRRLRAAAGCAEGCADGEGADFLTKWLTTWLT